MKLLIFWLFSKIIQNPQTLSPRSSSDRSSGRVSEVKTDFLDISYSHFCKYHGPDQETQCVFKQEGRDIYKSVKRGYNPQKFRQKIWDYIFHDEIDQIYTHDVFKPHHVILISVSKVSKSNFKVFESLKLKSKSFLNYTYMYINFRFYSKIRFLFLLLTPYRQVELTSFKSSYSIETNAISCCNTTRIAHHRMKKRYLRRS